MNTKKFFMLLAAVLLSSVSAMAQSGNNEPLRGDVNEDGTVDVADIAAVIAIIKNNAAPQTTYYWYVGTTPVDGNNYTSIASQVTLIPKTTTITLNNEYLYIVAPADKTVTVVDRDGFGTAMKTYNSSTGTFTHAFTTVNGYAIYKSVGEDTNEEIITISEKNI